MSASIFGDRFLGRREAAWHGLGQTFDAPIGALEAILATKLDYIVSTLPLGYQVDGIWMPLENRREIVRSPTADDPVYRPFGIASDHYSILQNTEIGTILDPLTEQWPVETVGALDYGKTMFLTLSAGEQIVGGPGGDEIKRYFLITDTKNGGSSLKIMVVTLRVVCQNTLIAASKKAVVTARISHYSTLATKTEHAVKLAEGMSKAQGLVLAEFDRMAKQTFSQEQVDAVFAAAYPILAKIEEPSLVDSLFGNDAVGDDEKVEALREAAQQQYESFGETSNLAGTAWAAYNAVVEVEDYREARRDANPQAMALWGSRARAKERAFLAAGAVR